MCRDIHHVKEKCLKPKNDNKKYKEDILTVSEALMLNLMLDGGWILVPQGMLVMTKPAY